MYKVVIDQLRQWKKEMMKRGKVGNAEEVCRRMSTHTNASSVECIPLTSVAFEINRWTERNERDRPTDTKTHKQTDRESERDTDGHRRRCMCHRSVGVLLTAETTDHNDV